MLLYYCLRDSKYSKRQMRVNAYMHVSENFIFVILFLAGCSPSHGSYHHIGVGCNYKNSNYLAAKCLLKRKLFSQHLRLQLLQHATHKVIFPPGRPSQWPVGNTDYWPGASSPDVSRGRVLYTK